MVKTRRMGFGVVGLGMGTGHCRQIVKDRRARLEAVCDIDEKRGRAAVKEFGVPWYPDYERMLNDPKVETVVVATPTGMHAEFAIKAAQAGKHVLCEKPLDIDLKRARRIVRACEKSGVKLQVGFQNRCTAASQQTRRDIERGRLGRLLFGEMIMHWYRSPKYFNEGRWRGTWEFDGGGAFMNQAIHWIDLMIYFLGRPTSVVGHTRTLAHPIETEDLGMAIVKFEGGIQAVLVASTLCQGEGDRTHLFIQGEKGSIRMSGAYVLDRDEVHLPRCRGRSVRCRQTTLYTDLVEATEQNREPVNSGREALMALAVIKSIYKSSASGLGEKISL